MTFLWLVGGEVKGWCSRYLSHQPLVPTSSASFHPGVTILHLGGGPSSCQRTQRCVSDCYVYPLGRSRDQVPSLQYCFFLHSLPSLISDCLNLPFGIQGRSRRLKPFSYKQEIGDTERLSCLGGSHRVLLGFSPPFSLLLLSLEGNRCWQRKGIRFWRDRLVINLVEDSVLLCSWET